VKKPVALGANIFAGGFSLGVSKHFRLLGHLEHADGYGAETSHRNLGVPVYVGLDQWPDKLPVKLDWLYANPPCAIWSLAAARKVGSGYTWRNDPRLQRIRDIFTLVDRYKPSVWTWESVCQAFQKGREFVEEIADEAEKRGYSTSYVLIDAMYLNTPQTRKRFFLVLHKIEIDWKKATPDYSAPIMTAGQALRGVKPDKGHTTNISNQLESKIIKHAKPGETLAKVFDRLHPNPKIGPRGQRLGRPSFLKRRLHPDRPSGVVIGETLFHPKEHRYLAANEAAALCGFPQSWEWPKADAYNLMARGVMPPVAEWLARNVARAVRAGKRVRKPARSLVDFRQPPGLIQDVSDLPSGVNLDWKPGQVSTGGRAGRRAARRAVAASGKSPVHRGSLPLEALAEATRKGIPDRKGRELIAQAVKGLGTGRIPATSGLLIRARLVQGKLADSEIVAEVLLRFEGRKTTVADVSYHRGKLRRAGMLV